MRKFYYMKPNPDPRIISRASYKIWMIERKGRKVTTWWAPAECTGRKVYPARTLRKHALRFRSEQDAIDHEKQRVQSKITKGYDPFPRSRPRAH